uniref:BAR/IMD domain-containing adapter protein 2 n=1 Tax=Cyprinus carpio TaxID=7962 RepID=A0A8C1VUR2_CYPCA
MRHGIGRVCVCVCEGDSWAGLVKKKGPNFHSHRRAIFTHAKCVSCKTDCVSCCATDSSTPIAFFAAHYSAGLTPTCAAESRPILVMGPLIMEYTAVMRDENVCDIFFHLPPSFAGVTFAAKGYFDALVRMGELASESQGSKDLGDVLFQMAEVHRQIQVQLEEMLKCFHNELLSELEKKVELDARYLTAALKKYQIEHKSKGESLEKCQGELKKLRRKSQGSKNPSKYSEKEMQYVETISSKQSELDSFIAEGYKTALSEERRRYCFLVDRQCAVAKNSSAYHGKGKDLLTQKIPVWQQACSDPNKLPDRAMLLAQQMTSGSSTLLSSPLHSSKGNLVISDPIPGAQPLPVPPELAALMGSGLGHQGRLMGPDGMSLVNGTTGVHGDDYWTDGGVSQGRPPTPQNQSQTQSQPQRQVSDVYSNTLPVRRPQPAKNKTTVGETRTLPRSSSMAAGLEKNGRSRVQAIFSHAAGDNSTLLSFTEGDIITLLVPEARDGWHYGENEKNKMRGWFPFSYTRVLPDSDSEKLRVNDRSLEVYLRPSLMDDRSAPLYY